MNRVYDDLNGAGLLYSTVYRYRYCTRLVLYLYTVGTKKSNLISRFDKPAAPTNVMFVKILKKVKA